MSETMAKYDTSKPAVAEQFRQATDVAGVCKAIVLKTAQQIQGRKYVRVEGWESIAAAHGCVPSVTNVRNEPDGIAATAELRRVDTGAVIATAEGFVGNDEKTWAGRPLYARRAMAQTRAISRVCRTAFAHVVVLMDAGLETTPAEEVPADGFDPVPVPAGADTVSEAQIKRLYAIAKIPKDSIASELSKAMPYLADADGTPHLLRLKKSDYAIAEQIVKGAKPADLPAGVTEIWPETEFSDKTEIHVGQIGVVTEPKSGKSGKPGPWKIDAQIGDQLVVLDTFDTNLAALAKRLAKECAETGRTVEIAILPVQHGNYLNRKLVGLR